MALTATDGASIALIAKTLDDAAAQTALAGNDPYLSDVVRVRMLGTETSIRSLKAQLLAYAELKNGEPV